MYSHDSCFQESFIDCDCHEKTSEHCSTPLPQCHIPQWATQKRTPCAASANIVKAVPYPVRAKGTGGFSTNKKIHKIQEAAGREPA